MAQRWRNTHGFVVHTVSHVKGNSDTCECKTA